MTDISADLLKMARMCTTDNEIAVAITMERYLTILSMMDLFTRVFDQGGASGGRMREMMAEANLTARTPDFISATGACANALFDFEERVRLGERERAAKVAEGTRSYSDNLQKASGLLTTGQSIAAAIRKGE